MPIIYNNLNSRILIHMNGSKYVDLLEKSTAEATDDDLLSSHLQCLIQRGFVRIGDETQKEVKIEEKVRDPIKDEEVKGKADKNLRIDKEPEKGKDENLNTENEVGEETDENLSTEIEINEEVDENGNGEEITEQEK